MKNKIVSAMISLVVCISASFAGAKASPITFAYTTTGNNFHGSFTFDDSYLNGTAFQFIPHSTITAFTFTVPGKTFGLEDLVSASSFIFNSAGTTPDVVGAAGITAIKDGRQLWFGDTGIVLVSNPSHSNYRGAATSACGWGGFCSWQSPFH